LEKARGDTALVNSYHHQSIATLGHGVRVTARAPDGVIEAIEVSGAALCLGLQWELQEECVPHGSGERILRLFIDEATTGARAPTTQAA
jgi:putative glutamine amidotransferase